ncbi:MAG: hypothetical protein PHR35_06620 [Kiritimatiellae bacterium]|nr:hypothetical protein [Kiritimatiellia bacterium]
MTMTMRRQPMAVRETTPMLSAWADLAVALALLACLPDPGTRLLWAVPFALWPHIADWLGAQAHLTGARDCVFVPDPHRPDWRALTSCLSAAVGDAVAARRATRVLLCGMCDGDSAPVPYTLTCNPARGTIEIRHGDGQFAVRTPARVVPALPLPLVVADRPVQLVFAPLDSRTIRLSLSDAAAVSLSLPAALLPATLSAVVAPRLVLPAIVTALARLLSSLAAGGRVGWWPFRWSPRACAAACPPVTARFDTFRVWVAGLWLLRLAGRNGPLAPLLEDPLRLYLWGLAIPLMLAYGVRRHVLGLW